MGPRCLFARLDDLMPRYTAPEEESKAVGFIVAGGFAVFNHEKKTHACAIRHRQWGSGAVGSCLLADGSKSLSALGPGRSIAAIGTDK
jgi:hypothetical protein